MTFDTVFALSIIQQLAERPFALDPEEGPPFSGQGVVRDWSAPSRIVHPIARVRKSRGGIDMKQHMTAGGEAPQTTPLTTTLADPAGLDAHFAELIETVFECERIWTVDDHVDVAIRYGR